MESQALKYLLDSCIVIDHFNGVEAATAFLREHGSECAVSVVTRAEVLTGFTPNAEALARELLDVFLTLPLDAEAADAAARLRRTRHLKLPDAFQAAVAVQHELALVTRNTRDFHTGGAPEVLVPYRV